MGADGPVRVSIVGGVCVHHDAVSNSMVHQLESLRTLGLDAHVYCMATDRLGRADATVTASPWSLFDHRHFRDSDVVIYHLSTACPLHDALTVRHPRARSVVHFHNVTPPELLTEPGAGRARAGLDQMTVAEFADAVWADSAHNIESARALGVVLPEDTRVLEFLIPSVDGAVLRPRPEGTPRMLFVGRPVRAKGLPEWLDCFRRLREDGVEVDGLVAGSSRWADAELMAELRGQVDSSDGVLRMAMDLSDEDLAQQFVEADVMVMPSHHEGFCVPVVEALAAGCRVVCSDRGALPETVHGLGTVVSLEDPAVLQGAVRAEVGEAFAVRTGDVAAQQRRARWFAEVSAYIDRFGQVAFDHRLQVAVDDLLAGPPATRPL